MLVATEIADALAEARQRTLDMVAPFSDAQMETAHSELMSPLAWDLAHIAAYEDLWLVHRHGGEPLLHPELAAMYDAFETPRAVRGDLPILNRAEAIDYLADVRQRALAILERNGPSEIHEMVLQHEHQHNETMLQAIELARLPTAPGLAPAARAAAQGHGETGLDPIAIPAGPFAMGAPDERFAYDNERPRHMVDLPGFRIGRTAITNATFLHFVEGGGYQRREWWSDEGWAWKEEYDITHPQGWTAGWAGSAFRQWRIDGEAPLHPEEPVVHISWFEADAFARSHGARLPTEAEWEKAATWTQARLVSSDPPTSTRPASAPTRWATAPPAPRSECSATPGSGPRPSSTATPASPPTRTASTPRSSSAAATASCAAARGRRASASPPRRSATGTSPSGARSSPA